MNAKKLGLLIATLVALFTFAPTAAQDESYCDAFAGAGRPPQIYLNEGGVPGVEFNAYNVFEMENGKMVDQGFSFSFQLGKTRVAINALPTSYRQETIIRWRYWRAGHESWNRLYKIEGNKKEGYESWVKC